MKYPLASFFAGRVLSKAVAGATLVGLATAVPAFTRRKPQRRFAVRSAPAVAKHWPVPR